jgi:tetratricopeptide (TPR) repeat protein
MAMPKRLGVLLAAGLLVVSAVAGRAQSAPTENPAPCSIEPEPQPCGTTPAAKSTSPASQNTTPTATGQQNSTEKFPFPGETSADVVGPALPDLSDASAPSNAEAKANAGTTSPEAAANAAANAASSANAAKKAATQFPFPEDDKGSGANGGADLSGTSKDSSSSSSSSNATDDAADAAGDGAADSTPIKDKGSEGASGRHLLHRVNPVATKLQSPEEREAEDLSIAHYYIQTGNFAGAYLRSQDAVKTVPDDPDAHFALAEAALKMNKREEAIAEYNACLKLDPPDKQAKAVRKALARLTP